MGNSKESVDTAPPVFDYDDFLNRIDGDVDLMKEVIEIFLQDTPGLLADLYAGIKSNDANAVERAAHTLKGATANISAKRLQSLSHDIQRMLKNKRDAEHLESRINDFEENFELLDRVLRDYLKK